jgi:hypothetical protein
MFKFLRKDKKKDTLEQVAKDQLKKNLLALESLRDYDIGKKDISTRTAEERLPNIRVAS